MRQPMKWGEMIVPYVAAWSSETPSHVAVDSNASNMHAVFRGGTRGEGRPGFGKMDETRQRECMTRRRCQVCRVPLDRRFVMEYPETIQQGFISYPMITEPPTCGKCAIYSLENCPGIKNRMNDPKYLLAEVFVYRCVAQIIKPAHVPGYEQLDKVLSDFGKPAVGYVKAMLERYDKLTLDEFRERIAHG